jgi:hypothetical protein
VIWLTGSAVALISRDKGRRVQSLGVQQLNAMSAAGDEWTHPRRTKERRRASALAERAAAEAQARAKRAEAEAPILAARARAEAEAKAKAQREWLHGPPPTLYVPRRFSEDWFADNVPKLHPGQVPTLLAELRARGWTDQRIGQRIARYLAANPFYEHEVGPPPAPQASHPVPPTTPPEWRGLHGGTGEVYVGGHVVDPSGRAGQVEQVLAPGRALVRWEDGTTSLVNPG